MSQEKKFNSEQIRDDDRCKVENHPPLPINYDRTVKKLIDWFDGFSHGLKEKKSLSKHKNEFYFSPYPK